MMPNIRVFRYSRLRRCSLAISVICQCIGLLVIIGWLAKIEVFKSIFPGFTTMKINTAIGFILCGISLWLLQKETLTPIRQKAVWVFAGLAFLLGLFTLLEYLFQWNLGIDELFLKPAPEPLAVRPPGRMSFITALIFLLLGLSLILHTFNRWFHKTAGQLLALLISVIPLIGLVAYCFTAQPIYQVSAFSSLALHTAATAALLCFGVLLICPEKGFMKTITSHEVGGILARRMLPFVVIIPIIFGWIRLWGQKAGYYDTIFGLVLLVVTFIYSFVFLVWLNAYLLNRIDKVRQRAETEVRQSEGRLASILGSAMDAIITIDEAHRITLFNAAAEQMFGCTLQEARDQAIENFIPERFRAAFQSHIQAPTKAAKQKGSLDTIYGLRANGEEFPIEASISHTEIGGRKLFTIILRDITERLRTEEVRFKLASIVESSSDAIITKDLNGVITSWNASAERLFGYKTHEVVGQPITILIPPELHYEEIHILAKLRVGERIEHFETVRITRDAQRINVSLMVSPIKNHEGQIVGISKIARDITEQQRVREVLRQSEEHFRALFEGAGVGNVECEATTGKFLLVNQKMAEITGYSEEELQQKSFHDITHPADRTLYADLYQQFITQQINHYAVEKRYVRKDGSTVWVHVTSSLLCDAFGQPWRTVAAIQDITERKRIELEIQQLNADLEQRVNKRTEELAAVNRELESFAYSVSHDLRAPLRAIDGFSRILMEDFGTDLPVDATEYLQLVRDNTQQMGRLIDDFLNLSRVNRQAFTKQFLSPNTILRLLMAELEPDYKDRQIEFIIDDLPNCYADHSLLKQVYVNLLSNALKFTRNCEPGVIHIGCLTNGPSDSPPVYFVKDNGAGFDMKYAHKLFNVFQRLHRAEDFEGTGVGLAIVQRIIQRHGGKIWAEGAINEGATFYFTIEESKPL